MVQRFILSLLACLLLLPPTLFAQGAPNLVGDVELEQEEVKKTGYAYTQDTILEYLETLYKQMNAVPGVGMQTQKNLSHSQTNYMAALYLHCSQKLGPCPAVLDTLLEMDVINSKLTGTIACPNLTNFWKVYVSTDMDRRLELDLSVGLINKIGSFNKTVRNQYVKCKEFVNNIITGGANDSSDFFSKRYTGVSAPEKAVKKTYALARTIKKSEKNLFYITGIKN